MAFHIAHFWIYYASLAMQSTKLKCSIWKLFPKWRWLNERKKKQSSIERSKTFSTNSKIHTKLWIILFPHFFDVFAVLIECQTTQNGKFIKKKIFHEFDGNCYWNSAHQFTFHDAITAVLKFIPFTMKFLSIFFSAQIGSELTVSEPIECIFLALFLFFISGNRVWHNNEMSKWMNACDLTWIDNEFIDINVMFGFVHF